MQIGSRVEVKEDRLPEVIGKRGQVTGWENGNVWVLFDIPLRYLAMTFESMKFRPNQLREIYD